MMPTTITHLICRSLQQHGGSARKGVSTVMMLVFLPCLVVLTILVTDIGSTYVGKTELKHALEAGALAAVRSWSDPKSDPDDAYAAALAYTAANTVRGECPQLNRMVVVKPESSDSPEVTKPAGQVTLGSVIPDKSSRWLFLPDVAPDKPGSYAAAQLEMTQTLRGNFSEIFGLTKSEYEVSGQAFARVNDDGEAELIRATVSK